MSLCEKAPASRSALVRMLGVIVAIAGVFLIMVPPTTVRWEPRVSTVIDEVIELPPKKMLKTEVLKMASVVVPPLWDRREEHFFEDDIKLPWYTERKYVYTHSPVFVRPRDIVITGTATENSSKSFSFYVLDSENLFRWSDREEFTALFEGEGKASYAFSLSFASGEDIPFTLYFAVEKLQQGLSTYEMYERHEELNVHVRVEALGYERRFYPFSYILPSEIQYFGFNCTVEAEGGMFFDLYETNTYGYDKMIEGRTNFSKYEAHRVSWVSFSATPSSYSPLWGLEYRIDLCLDNPYSNSSLTVNITIRGSRIAENPASVYSKFVRIQSPASYMPKVESVRDPKYRIHIHPFLGDIVYGVLDSENYLRLTRGASFTFVTSDDFLASEKTLFVPLSLEKSTLPLYLFISNPRGEWIPTLVEVSVELAWEESTIIPLLIGGIPPGLLVIALGTVVAVVGVAMGKAKPSPSQDDHKTAPMSEGKESTT